jgi:hypothetical protein
VKERYSEQQHGRWIHDLSTDVRHAFRTLRGAPGFTLLVVMTLGLGIGANTAIFSVLNGVVLKPLPYAAGDRLLVLEQTAPLGPRPNVNVSVRELYDYREQTQAFDALVEYHQMTFDLLNRGEPDRVKEFGARLRQLTLTTDERERVRAAVADPAVLDPWLPA